jgi:hypothetical protein
MKKYIFSACILFLILLFARCPSPGTHDLPTPWDSGIDAVPDNYTVGNIKASRLEYEGMIRISWYDRFNIGTYESCSYVVFRYQDKNDEFEVVFRDIKTPCYEDKSAGTDTMYFYRVGCVVKGKELPQSPNYTPGIVSSIGITIIIPVHPISGFILPLRHRNLSAKWN